MKSGNGFRVGLVLLVFVSVCPSMSLASLSVLFYDNFDDGDYSGWTVENRTVAGTPVQAPEVVMSPEGYSVRGTGSGYHPDWSCFITHPINLQNVQEIRIELRAKSGPQWPNEADVYLLSGQSGYSGGDYGESNQLAHWRRLQGTDFIVDEYCYPIGQMAYEWHTFAWTRDWDGWWSLSIDGGMEASNFWQNLAITSFDHVEIQLHRDQSEIEWVRISGNIIPEPATLLLFGLGAVGLRRKRRA